MNSPAREGNEVFPTLYPYAISSSNIIVVGGPLVNLAAEYFNDFTDALVYTKYEHGFYAPGCWARTSQPSLAMLEHQGAPMDTLTADELWYDSTTVGDRYGYAIVSTYKDINGTVGLIVYGYTAEDTYYACYLLRGGLIPYGQELQDGVTTVVIEIDYEAENPEYDFFTGIHPVGFHIKECLGLFTECTGAYTNFKTSEYYENIRNARSDVEDLASELGLCYKLVDFEFCAQIHPDP